MELELKHQLVLVEGRIYPTGIIIEQGAVHVPDEVVPVVWNFDFDRGLLGHATNWRRDEATGECWMDLVIDTPFQEGLKLMDLTVFLIKVTREEPKVIDSGILKALSYVLPIKGGWHHDSEEVAETSSTDSGPVPGRG